MCAPFVIEEVRREVSRRKALGVLGATLAASFGARAEAQERPTVLAGGFTEIHDLTHTLSAEMPVYPVFEPFQMESTHEFSSDQLWSAYRLSFNEHTGTHMDAPIHFDAGAIPIDQIEPAQFFAPLVVISIRDRAQRDHDSGVTVDDVREWERRHGRLPNGAFVAMHSGWDERIGDSERFLNIDAAGFHHPGFTGEVARFLTEERDIVGVGVDAISLDVGTASGFPAHLTILPAGKYGLEVMANLGAVPPAGATIIIGAMKHQGGTGGPVRAFAVS